MVQEYSIEYIEHAIANQENQCHFWIV